MPPLRREDDPAQVRKPKDKAAIEDAKAVEMRFRRR
jgi:hypothetical protein